MGGSQRRCLQVPEVGGCGSAVGSEEEKQQHDLRETEPSYEVRLRPQLTAHNYHQLLLIIMKSQKHMTGVKLNVI